MKPNYNAKGARDPLDALGLTNEHRHGMEEIEHRIVTHDGKIHTATFIDAVDRKYPDLTLSQWCAIFFQIGTRYGEADSEKQIDFDDIMNKIISSRN